MGDKVYNLSTKSDSNTESLSLNWDEDNEYFVDDQGSYKGQVLIDVPEDVDKDLLAKLKKNARYWSKNEGNKEAWISYKEAGLSGRSFEEMKTIFSSPAYKGSDMTLADAFDKSGYGRYLTHLQGKMILAGTRSLEDVESRALPGEFAPKEMFTFDKQGYKQDLYNTPIGDDAVVKSLEILKSKRQLQTAPAEDTPLSSSDDYDTRWDQIIGDQQNYNETINELNAGIDKARKHMKETRAKYPSIRYGGQEEIMGAIENLDAQKYAKRGFKLMETTGITKASDELNDLANPRYVNLLKETSIPDLTMVGFSLDELLQIAKDKSLADYAGEIGDID
tara:strand:+ start:1976 stop:2980 length:1005 start_codon:yes stop_codon:yes gene_type:complete